MGGHIPTVVPDLASPSGWPERPLERLHGWWEEAHLRASGDLFFAGAIEYYLRRQSYLRTDAESIVRVVADILKSTGFPEDRGLPAVPPGTAKKVQQQDELLGIRTASVKERW